MSSITKAKINLKEGIIELEGSETFVINQLEKYREQINKIKFPLETTPVAPKVATIEHIKEDEDKGYSRKKTGKGGQTLVPIPLDLKAKGDKPSLRDFYNQKKPANKSEAMAVFAYYLKENLGIVKMEAGHVYTCCREVGLKVPENIPQMFYDIEHGPGYLSLEEGRRLAVINTTGENFVIHDLPREDDAAGNKETT